jgi:hypothetical protein
MKIMLLSLLVMTSGAFAAPVSSPTSHQYIQCAPSDRDSSDRAIIALWPDRHGTLYLVSDVESDESSGLIQLKDVSQAGATDRMTLTGENGSSRFTVSLPASAFWQMSDDLKVSITLENKNGSNAYSEDLECFSRVYEE